MAIASTRDEMLDRLLAAYRTYFDIDCPGEDAQPLAASCHFHVRSAKYVLMKKAELWSANSNEHVYIFSMPHLTEELYRSCEKMAYDKGMALIEPDKEHMYTYITAVFLCDTCTEEAKKLLKKCRLYKSFHFSLHGWMEFHTALIERDTGKILTNHRGRANAKLMENIFMKKEKKRRV